MSNNSIPVVKFKVAVTKDVELKTSAKGLPYLRLNLLNKDDGDQWFTGMAFGLVAVNLAKVVKKGGKMLVSGSMREKEYLKKDGSPGVEKVITIDAAHVSDGSTLTLVDEFSGVKQEAAATEPF